MRTTEVESSETLRGWRRLRRNLGLLGRLARMMFYYWTRGRRLRRVYRACEARGEVLWVDEDLEETERRLR